MSGSRVMRTAGDSRAGRLVRVISAGLLLCLAGCRDPEPPALASQQAAAMDKEIDWVDARLIVVQDGGRYKTLDSFARESFAAVSGREHLPGLSPLASLLEWLFHREAYADTPLIAVRKAGMRAQLTAHMSEAQRQRVMQDKRLTPREAADPRVERVLREMESEPIMRRAVNRFLNALAVAEGLGRFLAIVPQPGGDAVAPWFTPRQVLANLSDQQLAELGLSRAALPPEAQQPLPGLTATQALELAVDWASLRSAWLRGDHEGVQRYLDRLSGQLPALAGPGVYPTRSQREAEARYYALGKFTGGWVLYFLGLLVSIWALVTRWRVPWGLTIILLMAGLVWHAYGLSLRWYILGRIPVANMFEAVVAAAWMGIALALVIELFTRTRIFLVAAHATGFLALVAAGKVLPGGALSTIPGILDDIQLRIHTVLIIASYALIFLAAVIAVCYLIGYYLLAPRRPLVRGQSRDEGLPAWLNNFDWSHVIVLHLVFVLLFLGTIFGAMWADYSWGRPWGWDPKEVFAMNTWLVYAILIHVRLFVRARGLWTAWLSIAGCLVMAFNWFFVNFFIASVHSYV